MIANRLAHNERTLQPLADRLTGGLEETGAVELKEWLAANDNVDAMVFDMATSVLASSRTSLQRQDLQEPLWRKSRNRTMYECWRRASIGANDFFNRLSGVERHAPGG